jgi:hypothetical protein
MGRRGVPRGDGNNFLDVSFENERHEGIIKMNIADDIGRK